MWLNQWKSKINQTKRNSQAGPEPAERSPPMGEPCSLSSKPGGSSGVSQGSRPLCDPAAMSPPAAQPQITKSVFSSKILIYFFFLVICAF